MKFSKRPRPVDFGSESAATPETRVEAPVEPVATTPEALNVRALDPPAQDNHLPATDRKPLAPVVDTDASDG
jgi:hypothetical protein